MVGCYDKIDRQTIISRINSLRGLFAIMIVIGHCSMYFEKELLPLMLIHKFNMVSVCFFFMASGLSLSYNLEHKKDYLKGFVRDKILLLLIFALIAQVIGEVLKGIGSEKPILFDIRIITGWNWYIYEIIVIYLIFYVVNRFVKNKYTKEVLFWVSALAICFVALYFFRNGRWEGWTGSYYVSTLSFPLGITIYLHFDSIQGSISRHPLIISVILMCVAACSCISLAMPRDSVFGGIFFRNIMGGCIMFTLFIMINYVDVTKIAVVSPIVLFLTGFSAEIYLYQFCLLDLWSSVYSRLGRNVDLSFVCVVVISTVILGYVTHFVDRRISKTVKGLNSVMLGR